MGQIPKRESAEPLAHVLRRDGAQSWSLNAAVLSNAGWLVPVAGTPETRRSLGQQLRSRYELHQRQEKCAI